MFEARFDPALDDRDAALVAARGRLAIDLDAIQLLDDDRICRAFLMLIDATVRTNRYQWKPALSFKLDPTKIPDLPRPRPMFEIFVCSPRVEGIHLRAGPIARGGIRWSDRREDFRTEVLGLVKAQMVKNAVIVPVGAKGGFVVKNASADPAEQRLQGAECYREFVRGMLDITDNVAGGVVQHPADAVVYDGDDAYLVVAADKGTATFSDLANDVAAEYDFWLGDAFASGGSAGYDHKAMGITARGAWESVRRHARVLGKNADSEPLTTVGIGDMSGDVFGNGMLRSRHLRLIAAFDHRHIFIDPDPDPEVSFAERRRLFELPRSSWADYDTRLISAGGGVYSRATKSITLSAEARAALGMTAERVTPIELIRAIMTAPVDLLWNGGIGTYVKAGSESHADVGDRANDSVRVDASELRCRMVAEGGNLGFTQLGRVEYALADGLIYTDAIDNSAGVDCSDHEVNIKILLGDVVAAGGLPADERNAAPLRDDGRGGGPRARQQSSPDARLDDRPPPGTADGERARPVRRAARGRSLARPSARVPADRPSDRRPPVGRPRAAHTRAGSDDGVHQERRRRRHLADRSARRSGAGDRPVELLPRAVARTLPGRDPEPPPAA